MRKLLLAVVLLLGNIVYARANTIDLKLINVGPGYNDTHYYVYPYNFSINGSNTLTSLLCDDFIDDVYFNESWKANVYTIGDIIAGNGQMTPVEGSLMRPTGSPMLPSQRIRAYEDAAWLYQELVANTNQTNAVDINNTIWALFSFLIFFVLWLIGIIHVFE